MRTERERLSAVAAEALANARDNGVTPPEDDLKVAVDMCESGVFGPTGYWMDADGTLDPRLVQAVRDARVLDAMYEADDLEWLH